jgi:hypothetical protein
MLFCTIALPINATIPEDSSVEIIDDVGDAFGYLDIEQISFYEKESDPDFLFVTMTIHDSSKAKFQQTFAVFWTYNDVQYACGLGVGFGLGKNWMLYNAGEYDNGARHGGPGFVSINGTYDVSEGTITWMIPKEIIRSPQQGDVLTHTWANAFRRLGFLGRIGFSRPILDILVFTIFKNSLHDYAPDQAPNEFGENYIIQY